MNEDLLDVAAVLVVAVAVIGSVTSLALRREARPRTDSRVVNLLASLPIWGGVLVTILLAARGKFALAGVAAVATLVLVVIGRVRGRPGRRLYDSR